VLSWTQRHKLLHLSSRIGQPQQLERSGFFEECQSTAPISNANYYRLQLFEYCPGWNYFMLGIGAQMTFRSEVNSWETVPELTTIVGQGSLGHVMTVIVSVVCGVPPAIVQTQVPRGQHVTGPADKPTPFVLRAGGTNTDEGPDTAGFQLPPSPV